MKKRRARKLVKRVPNSVSGFFRITVQDKNGAEEITAVDNGSRKDAEERFFRVLETFAGTGYKIRLRDVTGRVLRTRTAKNG